jgi:hypothetical protein
MSLDRLRRHRQLGETDDAVFVNRQREVRFPDEQVSGVGERGPSTCFHCRQARAIGMR